MCNMHTVDASASASASANAAADAGMLTLEPDATVLDIDRCTDLNFLHGILPIPD